MALSKFFKTVPMPTYSEPKLEDGEFSTDPSWWRVKKEGNKYTFFCLSGALQGGEVKAEITKEEYCKLVSSEITAYDICLKYNIG